MSSDLNRPGVRVVMLKGSYSTSIGLLKSGVRAMAPCPFCGKCGAIQTAALWKEYRTTVLALIEAGTPDDVDDDTAAFRLTIQTPVRAPVGHPEES